mgnify:CR=1 FL=1
MEQVYVSYLEPLYRRYQNCKNKEVIFLVPLVVVTLSKIMWNLYRMLSSGKGLPHCDDSIWYLQYANTFVANIKDGLDINDVLYFGYNLLLTVLLAMFQDPLAIVFIQAIAAGLSVILVYRISLILFTRATAIMASIFYCLTYDVALWTQYILSDSFFVSLLLLDVYLLLMALNSEMKSYKVLFTITSLYILVFRPTGLLCLAAIVLYLIIQKPGQIMALLRRYRFVIGTAASVVMIGGIYLYTTQALDPFIYSLQFNAKKVLYNVYAKGWIYDKPTAYDYFYRPNYTIDIWNSLVVSFIVNNWDHISVLYIRRAIAFLGTWVWQTDIKSLTGIITLSSQLLPTALFFIGTIAAVRNGLFRKTSILWLLIAASFIFCVLIFIDAMYRYKFPAMPFIAMVAAYGAEIILVWAYQSSRKLTEMLGYDHRENPDRNPGF